MPIRKRVYESAQFRELRVYVLYVVGKNFLNLCATQASKLRGLRIVMFENTLLRIALDNKIRTTPEPSTNSQIDEPRNNNTERSSRPAI